MIHSDSIAGLDMEFYRFKWPIFKKSILLHIQILQRLEFFWEFWLENEISIILVNKELFIVLYIVIYIVLYIVLSKNKKTTADTTNASNFLKSIILII